MKPNKKSEPKKPAAVEVSTVVAKGKINVKQSVAKAAPANDSGKSAVKTSGQKSKAASKPDAKAQVAKDEPKSTKAKQSLSPVQVRAFAAVALIVVVGGLAALAFGGGDEAVAEQSPAPVAPIVPAAKAEAVVEQVAVTPAEPEQPAVVADTPERDAMVDSIIGALRSSADSAQVPAPTAAQAQQERSAMNSLFGIVTNALNEGQSEEYVSQLLNDAQSRGQVQIPDALLRADGSIDTATILMLFKAQ